MKTDEIDAALVRLTQIAAETKKLTQERAAIIAKLPNGRTEGTELAVYIRQPHAEFAISIKLLRNYVTDEILRRCRVRQERGRAMKLVPKSKPKKQKEVRCKNDS